MAKGKVTSKAELDGFLDQVMGIVSSAQIQGGFAALEAQKPALAKYLNRKLELAYKTLIQSAFQKGWEDSSSVSAPEVGESFTQVNRRLADRYLELKQKKGVVSAGQQRQFVFSGTLGAAMTPEKMLKAFGRIRPEDIEITYAKRAKAEVDKSGIEKVRGARGQYTARVNLQSFQVVVRPVALAGFLDGLTLKDNPKGHFEQLLFPGNEDHNQDKLVGRGWKPRTYRPMLGPYLRYLYRHALPQYMRNYQWS